MAQQTPGQSLDRSPDRSGTIFGVPFGDLGWFSTLLMGVAAGFAALFASTFVAIMSLLFYVTVTHRPANSVDFSLTYRVVGFPIGVTVGVVALSYLGTLWVRRRLQRA